MKRFILVTIAVCLIAALSVTFVACNLFDKKNTEEVSSTYSVEGGSKTYTQNGKFSVQGMTLVVPTAKGETRKIALSDDMIVSMPDLTKVGKQQVEIRYEGESYFFDIEVTAALPSAGQGTAGGESVSAREMQKLIDDYLQATEGREGDLATHELKLSLLLKGNFKGLGQNLSKDETFVELPLSAQEDIVAEHLRKVFADALVSGVMAGEITEVGGNPQSTADLEALQSRLYEAAVEAFSEWEPWSDLFEEEMLTRGYLDEDTVEFLKEIAAQVALLAEKGENAQEEDFFAIVEEIEEFLLSNGIEWRDEVQEAWEDDLHDWIVENLPEDISGPILSMASILADAFRNKEISEVDYEALIEALAEQVSELMSAIEQKGEELSLESVFEKNKGKLAAELSEEEIAVYEEILRKLDALLLGDYSTADVYALLREILKVEPKHDGETLESYLTTIFLISATALNNYLPEDMTDALYDTTTSVTRHLRKKNGPTEQDYSELMEELIEIWTAEGQRYQDAYERGEFAVFEKVFKHNEGLLKDVLSDKEIKALESFFAALDEMCLRGVDEAILRAQANNLIDAFASRANLSDEEVTILKLWVNEGDPEEKAKETVLLLEDDITEALMDYLAREGVISGRDARELSEIIEGFISAYLSDESDVSDEFDRLIELLASNWSDDAKAESVFASLTAAIYADKALGYEVDYNEVFAFLPLPKGVKEVDYNRVIAKALEGKTAADIFYLSDPIVTYEVENGRLAKAIVTVKAGVTFEAKNMGTDFINMDVALSLRLEIDL